MSDLVEQELHAARRRNGLDEEHVAASPHGLQWRERNFSRRWESFREATFEDLGLPSLKFHATRHSFVSWALYSGVPVARVATWVGASPRVLERTYAHVLPETDEIHFLDRNRQE